MNYTVYLSSTSYHWWNFKSKNWKSKLIDLVLPFNRDIRFYDPLTFKSENPIVCPMDLKNIDESKYIVVYIDKLTIGTLLELGYCIYTAKNYCVLSFNKKTLNHPWIKYLCKDKVFTDYKSVVEKIISDYDMKKDKGLI